MKPRFNWRHQYDNDRDQKEGDLAALSCDDPSLTQQSFTQDADINEIARRFGLSDIPLSPPDLSAYRDTTEDPDLRQVLEFQRAARDSFMGLPAKLRKRFHNSPDELWAFVNDPENAEEAVRLGLLTAPSAEPLTTSPQPSASTPGAHGSPSTASTAPSAATTEQPPKPPQGA